MKPKTTHTITLFNTEAIYEITGKIENEIHEMKNQHSELFHSFVKPTWPEGCK